MRQTWQDLLFAHWPVTPDRLRSKVPSFLTLDTIDQRAWVSISPFRLSGVTGKGLPAVPWVSSFSEINLRTYVTLNGIPGVYFFSLDASSFIAVQGAYTFFHLPYFHAAISAGNADGCMQFASSRTRQRAEFRATYAPVTQPRYSQRGTLEYFLTERYCLYTTDTSGRGYQVDIHHRPWPLQHAEADVQANTLAAAAGLDLPSASPVLHFSRWLDVLTWAPRRIL